MLFKCPPCSAAGHVLLAPERLLLFLLQPVYKVSPGHLSRLCNALAEIALAEPAGCVVDLCGHTFAGGISDCDLSLPPKFTLCNGTLGMGTGKASPGFSPYGAWILFLRLFGPWFCMCQWFENKKMLGHEL